MGRLLSQDSGPTRSCSAEYPPREELEKRGRVQSSARRGPPHTGERPLRESKAGLQMQIRN